MKPTLAKDYTDQNPTGWLVSEKLDGVRCIWTGTELISRNGKPFTAPAWFTAALPKGVGLDGELWICRGCFEDVLAIIGKKTPVDAEWRTVRFMVFDGPNSQGDFSTRLANVTRILQSNPVATVVSHSVCKGFAHLQQMLHDIVSQGGEGVMIRNPRMGYIEGRTPELLKFKPFSTDEAQVTGTEHDSAGTLTTILAEWKGKAIRLGAGITALVKVKLGDAVTFSYSGTTDAGLPKCAAFLAVRNYE